MCATGKSNIPINDKVTKQFFPKFFPDLCPLRSPRERDRMSFGRERVFFETGAIPLHPRIVVFTAVGVHYFPFVTGERPRADRVPKR